MRNTWFAVLQPVSEQALCLGDECVERVSRSEGRIVLAFEREHSDLWSDAVNDDQFAAVGDIRQSECRLANVFELDACVCCLSTSQQRVPPRPITIRLMTARPGSGPARASRTPRAKRTALGVSDHQRRRPGLPEA